MEVPILFIMIWYLLLVMCLGRNDTEPQLFGVCCAKLFYVLGLNAFKCGACTAGSRVAIAC